MATASPAAVVVDPNALTESLAQHRAHKLRKSGAAWRKLIAGLFDDDPVKQAAAAKSFVKDRDDLVQKMGLSEAEATLDLSAMSEFVRLEKKVEAYDRDRRKQAEKKTRDLPARLETAVEHIRQTQKMIAVMAIELRSAKMDLYVAGENRERLRALARQSPRLFDQPEPEPVAAKPAADDSVTVKPTPTDDRNKTVTLHEVPIEGQGHKGEGPAAPKTKPATGGGRKPLILDELSTDAHPSATGDRQEDYDPLGR